MKRRILLMMVIAIITMSCGPTNEVVSQEELAKVNALIKNDTLTIKSNWAYPQNADVVRINRILNPNNMGGDINLVGNVNHFKKVGDSLSIYLPYYGVRQNTGGYNASDVGIKFDGTPKKTEYSFNEKKGMHQYEFVVDHDTENLQVYVQIFPKLSTVIRVNSSHRTSISYRGKVIKE